MDEHPEDVDALKLSKYSGFVAEVVSAKPKIDSAKHESVGTSGIKASDNSQKIGSTKQKFESAKSENTGGND